MEIEQEVNAYEAALMELKSDKECQPYCPGPMKRKLSDLSVGYLVIFILLISCFSVRGTKIRTRIMLP